MGRTRRHVAPRVAAAIAVAIAVAVVVVGGASIGGAGAGPTTTAPTTTARPTTTAAAATTTTVAATTTTGAPLPEPESEEADPARTLVPNIVAFPEAPDDRPAAIQQALTERRNSVGLEQPPELACAVVPVSAPVTVAGRWERDGELLAEGESLRRDPPGFGDCYSNDDGSPLAEGVYQYVAIGATGARSAVATLVVGEATAAVYFVNNGDADVCIVQASPTAADFFESFDTDSPLLPGQAIAIRLATIEQDVRVFGCPPDDLLRSFQLTPEADGYVDLFEPAEPSATGGGATTAAPRATTTTTTTA